MKTINESDYKNDGILINLDTKYYFICKNGIKSKEVVSRLELFGYDVTRVLH